MTDWSSNVHDLHPPGDRLTLRGQAAELLIAATDAVLASRALFDLIAAELKLNVLLLYRTGEDGLLELIVHRGLSEAEATMAAAQNLRAFGGGEGAPAEIPLAGHVTMVQESEDGPPLLRSLGLKAWFGQPLIAGERLLGVIGFGRRWADSFHDDDVAFLQTVAHYFAFAIERLRGNLAQRESEQRVRESEERLRLAVETTGLGVFDYHSDINDIVFSTEFKSLYGFSREEPFDVDMALAQIHPEDRPRMEIPAVLARIDGQTRLRDEYRIIRRDGTLRWMMAEFRVVSTPSGPTGRIMGIIHDITERKLAEHRLRESEERLRLAIEAAGFGVFDYDVDRDEAIWSPELKAIYGFAPDEDIDLEMAIGRVHPDDQARIMAPIIAARAARDFIEMSEEYRIIRPDGTLRWLALKAHLLKLLPGSGQSKRLIGVIQDITERKLAERRLLASEQRLQLAQEMGGVASFECDLTVDQVWVSESYRRIFGLLPADQIVRSRLQDIVHPEDADRVPTNASRVWETGKTKKFEFRIIRPTDQQERWIWAVYGLAVDPSIGAKRLVGIALDITDRKRDEERERLLTREVDHRAKNLLSLVKAMVRLTHADSIPDFVEQIEGRILALGRVHGLLAASRWEGAELSKLIQDELAPFDDDGKRVRLSGPGLRLAPAAAQSMALVIHELTTNAAKHGALAVPGGRVEVRWDRGDAAFAGLRLWWTERGGAVVTPPQHFGFGLTHMRGSIEHQLGGVIDLQWPAEGLQCELSLPAKQLVPG